MSCIYKLCHTNKIFCNTAEQPVKTLKQFTFVQILETNPTHYYMCGKNLNNINPSLLPKVLLQFWNVMVYFY